MDLITIEELSSMLRIKIGTLRSLCFQKKIPHVKIGRLVRFLRRDISKWIEERSQKILP